MDLDELQKLVIKFRDDRNWKQFHNPKDMAISLSLEASELLEHFQWKNPEEINEHLKSKIEDVSDELADVLYWVLLMANDLNIDLYSSLTNKIEKNDKKYPVSKSINSHRKYTEL